jgi:hypothetical protein
MEDPDVGVMIILELGLGLVAVGRTNTAQDRDLWQAF